MTNLQDLPKMEALNGKLKTELQLLQLTQSKTQGIVDKGNVDKILRHKESLAKIIVSVEELKMQIQKAKLEADESVEVVQKWGEELETRIDEADEQIVHLGRCLSEAAKREELVKREEEEVLLARKREEELQFEKKKLEQILKLNPSDPAAAKPAKESHAKLPKLVITKYNGKYETWLSFWHKFQAEIDSTDLPAVTKFSHLKELLEPHASEAIDGLPFTNEGYERATNIY